jgi:hypothetical protein
MSKRNPECRIAGINNNHIGRKDESAPSLEVGLLKRASKVIAEMP